jgi:endo-1,4-beta-mannosidase
MWRNWNEESVRKDIEALKNAGITLLRVFPDWSYFQPITEIKGWRGGNRGYSISPAHTIKITHLITTEYIRNLQNTFPLKNAQKSILLKSV